MNVIERGTAVRRLAPSQAPGYPPTTLSEQGLVDKIAGTEADVQWSVTGDVLGRRVSIPERMPLTSLLPLEYQILFSGRGTSGRIVRYWEGSTVGSHIGTFTGRIPAEISEPFQRAVALVTENAPGALLMQTPHGVTSSSRYGVSKRSPWQTKSLSPTTVVSGKERSQAK